MKPERMMNRRTFLKILGLAFAGMLAAPFAGYGYSRYVEPRLVRTKRITLELPRLPEGFDGMRMVQFSDIHLDFHFGIGRMEDLVNQLLKLKPDMLVFTGDLYDRSVGPEAGECARLLSSLEAPLGKWAVLGNHDYEAGNAEVWTVLENGGFTMLANSSQSLKRNGAAIRIAGVDDMVTGRPDAARALAGSDGSPFTVLLSHAPDYADIAVRYPIDLQLSGHSHGGQVRLPFRGSLFTPKYARVYPDGLYSLENGKLHVYTNRGIGFSTMPVRFWCPPEITVFTLKTAKSSSASASRA
jgi:uncharacterized protein